MNEKQILALLSSARKTRIELRDAVKVRLAEVGQPVEFDWEENEAPSYASSAFDNDLSDAYITKIWLNDGRVFANLYAYYLGETATNVDLTNEAYVDWDDILEHLIDDYNETNGLVVSILNALVEKYCEKYPDEYEFDAMSFGYDLDGEIITSNGDGKKGALNWVLKDVIPDLIM